MKRFIWILAFVVGLAHATGSTINTAVPAANSALQSAPIRANFAAAASDINGLIGLNNGVSAPVSPVLGQMWLNTSSTPYVLNVWDGDSWDAMGTLNISTSKWAVPIAQGGTGLTAAGSSGCVLTSTGSVWVCSQPTNTGTVTSVGLILPSALFNITGSPVTTSGTLAASLQTQTSNTFLAGPTSGGSAAPTFRAIVAGDIPTLNQNTTGTASNVTGVVGVANGGTGLTTCSTSGYVLSWTGSAWACVPSTAGGTVTSVGLSLPLSIFSISGSPVTGTGTLTGSLNNEPANFVWAGPTSGGSTTPAFRALVGADLPLPSASTLGGIQSLTSTSHQWVNAISTSGVPSTSQPAFTDVSGSLACSQTPAFTGDSTKSAGSCATTVSSIGGKSVTLGGSLTTSGANNVTLTTTATTNVTLPASGTVLASSTSVSGPCTGTPSASTFLRGDCTWSPASISLNGYINGFGLSNDGTSSNTVLDIAAGYATDSTNTVPITGTAWTKTTGGTFVAGTGNAGLGSGLTLTANTGYHVFAIICSGSFDIYFDTSITAANKPACTSSFRYIGDFRVNASSNILGFSQQGQKITYNTAVTDVAASNTSLTTYTATVPSGVVVFPIQRVFPASGSAVGTTCSYYPGTGSTGTPDAVVTAQTTSAANTIQIQTTTNTSGQLSYVSSSTNTCDALTIGYINPHLAPNF